MTSTAASALFHPQTGSLAEALFRLSAAAQLVVDRGGVVTAASPAAQRLLGRDPTGQPLTGLVSPAATSTLAGYLAALSLQRSREASAHTESEILRPDGRVVPVQLQGVNALGLAPVDGLVLTLFDITVFQQREDELHDRLGRDPLTGLPSRQRFRDCIDAMLAQWSSCSAALIDLDQFKRINDTHGHAAGDRVLQSVALRLMSAVDPDGAVLRFGGDEFVLLLPGEVDPAMLQRLDEVRRHASAPIAMGETVVSVGLSIGVTTVRRGALVEAMQECDAAMYAAKILGRGRVAAYGDEVHAALEGAQSLAAKVDQLMQSNRQLHTEARTDALTGLANRRALAEVEAVTVGNAGSAWSACTVLFVDADHFGRYNKRYGDQAGDEALRRLAAGLRTVAREHDRVFRKGGEEFVAVLPNLDLRAGVGVAERMRATVQALAIPHADGTEAGVLTVSVTVSNVLPGTTVGHAIARAGDAAMAAKDAGRRNAVNIAS